MTPEEIEAVYARTLGQSLRVQDRNKVLAFARAIEEIAKLETEAHLMNSHADLMDAASAKYRIEKAEADRDHWKAAFKNFHRSLCARFGYTHDEADWQRDQVSLEEHIAKLADRQAAGLTDEAIVQAVHKAHAMGRVALTWIDKDGKEMPTNIGRYFVKAILSSAQQEPATIPITHADAEMLSNLIDNPPTPNAALQAAFAKHQKGTEAASATDAVKTLTMQEVADALHWAEMLSGIAYHALINGDPAKMNLEHLTKVVNFFVSHATSAQATPPDGPGTPSARLKFILSELAKRFPEADKPLQSDPPELRFLAAIDASQATPEGDELPPLPKPRTTMSELNGLQLFSADQMRDYAREAVAERKADTNEGIAECMRMFRDDMIAAEIITAAVPPMFMSEAILGYIGKLERGEK